MLLLLRSKLPELWFQQEFKTSRYSQLPLILGWTFVRIKKKKKKKAKWSCENQLFSKLYRHFLVTHDMGITFKLFSFLIPAGNRKRMGYSFKQKQKDQKTNQIVPEFRGLRWVLGGSDLETPPQSVSFQKFLLRGGGVKGYTKLHSTAIFRASWKNLSGSVR